VSQVVEANAGIVVLQVAFGRWVAGVGEEDLRRAMRASLERLRTVTSWCSYPAIG
jgi:hypothetical protein